MKLEALGSFLVAGIPTKLDRLLHANPRTKRSSIGAHHRIWTSIASFANQGHARVLEIGSRSVASDSLWKSCIPNCSYTGLDILAGKNVDVVGDAHRLSDYFAPNSFDLVISLAVFEHLAMPWLVAEEIAKVLDINGVACIETHCSYSEHELPWHYFQFNSQALETMFCEELGFTTIDSGVDNPVVGRFSKDATEYLRGKLVSGLWCHSSIITRKTAQKLKHDECFDWRKIIGRISAGSMYPANTGLSKEK